MISGSSKHSVRRAAAQKSDGVREATLRHREWFSQAMASGAAAAKREAAIARWVPLRVANSWSAQRKNAIVERHACARMFACRGLAAALNSCLLWVGRLKSGSKNNNNRSATLSLALAKRKADFTWFKSTRLFGSELRYGMTTSLEAPTVNQELAHSIKGRHRTTSERPTRRRHRVTRREGTSNVTQGGDSCGQKRSTSTPVNHESQLVTRANYSFHTIHPT